MKQLDANKIISEPMHHLTSEHTLKRLSPFMVIPQGELTIMSHMGEAVAQIDRIIQAIVDAIFRVVSVTFGLVLPLLFSLLLTVFLFTNSYEIAFNKDLPHIKAVEPVAINNIVTPSPNRLKQSHAASYEGGYGTPLVLKVPFDKLRIPVVPAILSDDTQWLARSNSAHYYIATPSKNNNLGTTVFYLRQSWRTIVEPAKIQKGDNLFVDTNRDWRYMYRVTDSFTSTSNDPYIIEDSRVSKLIIVVSDPNTNQQHVIIAEMINVQNIQN
jgi:hypothetical protein